MKSVLVITRDFPPIGGGGVQRPLSLARHLPSHGWTPVFLTGPGRLDARFAPTDESLSVPSGTEVHRVPGPEPGPPTGWGRVRRSLLLRSEWERWWQRSVFTEGTETGRGVDCVYAWMQPYPSAAPAASLAAKLNVPWVAEMGDPWAFDEMMTFLSPLHQRVERRRMRNALASAAAILMSTPEAARRVVDAFPEMAGRTTSLPYGYNGEDFSSEGPDDANARFRIVHAGTLHTQEAEHRKRKMLGRRSYLNADLLSRSHVFLLEAVSRLIEAEPSARRSVEVVLAGDLSPRDNAIAAQYPFVTVLGYLDHKISVALMRSATLLFLPMYSIPSGFRAGIIPGKTYEYMASERPILAAVPEGDARDVITKSGLGIVCDPADPEQLFRRLSETYHAWRQGALTSSPDRDYIRTFDRRDLVRRFSQILDSVVGSAAPATITEGARQEAADLP